MKKLLCLTVLTTSVLADIAVIVHPSNNGTADADAIARVFLGKSKSLNDNTAVTPVAQVPEQASSEEFNNKVLNKNAAQLKAYWSQLVFTGKGTPPRELANDNDVVQHVAAQPNAIGYVSASAVNGSVKVLLKF
jgi:ABC-type phosphate transport system substrate-binding protein